MKPGRELDALVAEKVMGWRRVEFTGDTRTNNPNLSVDAIWDSDFVGSRNGVRTVIPAYSTDIASAWEVVEKIDKQVTVTKCRSGYMVTVEDFYCHATDGIVATPAPFAICLAALKAVGHSQASEARR